MAAFSHPSWDFEDSASEAEIDYNTLQPFELAQQSLRPERKRSALPSSALPPSQPIPTGPNQPGMQRSKSFGDVLGGRPAGGLVEEDVRRGTSTTAAGDGGGVPLADAVGQQPTTSSPSVPPGSPIRPVRPRAASGSGLNRSQTLLSHTASPQRSSHELSRLLAKSPSSRKLGGGADGRTEDDARLEAGRRKARVTLDVDLEREVLVEGGDVKGTMIVVVRPGSKKEGPVHVGLGKIRLVGFEDVPSHAGRHIFYHHSATLPVFTPGGTNLHRSSLFTATPGTHHPSNPGSHPIPFHLPLPLTDFPRGPHRSASSAIRYILIGSLSLFFPFTGQSSIAHFYRNIVIYPRIDPARVLGSAGGNAVENARSFGNPGGRGVELGVKVGKAVWVAGMSCWVDISMYNGTSKKVKSLTVQLWQTTVLYHPSLTSTRPNSVSGNLDPGSTSTKSKKIAETVLAEAQASGKGLITGKGWFTGCAPMTAGAWSTSLVLPPDALSIPRGRLIEVGYTVRVCIDSKIFVEVPIRIVNFISIDPPPSTYRPPLPVTAVPANLAARRGPAAPAAPALPTEPVAHDSPKSTYTDGVIGYDTISRPRMPHGPASSLASGTLASTLKKARSMGSLAFPGEMGNRAGGDKGPLRVANRGGSSSDEDEASDVDDGEGRGLIRRKVSMAVLKEAVDAAARETDGYGDAFDEEDAYGYAYNDDDVDLGVDIPKLVEASTHIAAGDTIEEADEEVLASSQFEDPLDEENGFVDSLLPNAPSDSSPKSQTPTVLSDEGAFAFDDRRSLAPLSNLPTPMEEHAPILPDFPIPTLPIVVPAESSESIGEAMQTMLLDDADSDESDDELASAAPGGAPRFPEGRGRAPSPMLRAARAASLAAAISSTADAGSERRGSESVLSRSSQQQHPSQRLSLAWGGASAVSGGRPASSYEPTYEEVRNALTQGRRSSAATPEPAFRPNGRLSINTDLIHPEVMQKPRAPSPAPGVEQAVILPSVSSLTQSPAALTPSSPAKSISKRKSFSFASPAAPIRVKTSVASPRDGSSPSRPPRLRSSASSVSLRRVAAEDSPVRAKAPSSAFVGITSPTKSSYASMSGRESPTKADAWFGSPRRSRTLHASPASPLKVAPAAREVPGLADGRASSDSGSASEATPPLESAAFPPPVPTINFADKLQFTNRHLSQYFDSGFDAVRAGGPPRANSVDSQQPFIKGSSRTGGAAAGPSVKSKVQRLESRQAAHPAVIAELGLPPALRRSATTASPRYGPSDDLKFVRPGHHRKESSISSETAEALAAESNLRRAPSGVSFKAPLLRHSKSMAGNPRKDS